MCVGNCLCRYDVYLSFSEFIVFILIVFVHVVGAEHLSRMVCFN